MFIGRFCRLLYSPGISAVDSRLAPYHSSSFGLSNTRLSFDSDLIRMLSDLLVVPCLKTQIVGVADGQVSRDISWIFALIVDTGLCNVVSMARVVTTSDQVEDTHSGGKHKSRWQTRDLDMI